MNWDQIEGNWKEFKGKVKARWGRLTDDELDVIDGKREALSGKLQKQYGYSRERAEEELKRWMDDTPPTLPGNPGSTSPSTPTARH